ncbi:tetratricopeptide repeat protein [Novosphingobium resinovorum]|nr:tetratricopeptide repeat protein [Novosphingobium resinovorum]
MKRPVRLVLPLVALGMVSACGDSPETLFAHARADFAAENYQEARVQLASALRGRPEDRAMLALFVETQLRLGDPDGAEGAIARLERAGDRDTARMKAEAALLRQNPRRALELLGTDASSEGWRVRAESQLALGDEVEARAAFEKGLDAKPATPAGEVRLAASYARYLLQNDDLTRAAWLLTRMQAMAPRAYETLVMAGDLASAQGREEEAARAYRKAIDAFPDRAAPMLALANHYDGLGNLDEASRLVEQAGNVAPGDPEVDALRIQLMSEKGEWEKIRLALQSRESELAAGSPLSMTYGEALLRLGQAEQARIIFRRAALVLPGNPYSRMMLGEAQIATGDRQGAWATLAPLAASTLARPEVLERAEQAARGVGAPEAEELQARLDPVSLKETMALVQQGENALAAQRWATAATVYERLLARGEDPEVLKRLAIAETGLGDHAAAIGHADKAVSLNRGSADYLYVAALARISARREPAEVRRLLEAAAAIDPRNQAIARDLRKAKAAAG